VPSWIASYVWTLSGGRITPDTLDYLLWELPLKIGWQCYHSELLKQGAKTVRADASVSNTVAQLEQLIAQRNKGN
jgi:hypothetical protein